MVEKIIEGGDASQSLLFQVKVLTPLRRGKMKKLVQSQSLLFQVKVLTGSGKINSRFKRVAIPSFSGQGSNPAEGEGKTGGLRVAIPSFSGQGSNVLCVESGLRIRSRNPFFFRSRF